jgi:hypothetical protein
MVTLQYSPLSDPCPIGRKQLQRAYTHPVWIVIPSYDDILQELLGGL